MCDGAKPINDIEEEGVDEQLTLIIHGQRMMRVTNQMLVCTVNAPDEIKYILLGPRLKR